MRSFSFIKVALALALMFSAAPSFAASREYVSSFRKARAEKSTRLLQKGLQKDAARIASLFSQKASLHIAEGEESLEVRKPAALAEEWEESSL